MLYQSVGNVTETWTKWLLSMGAADENAKTSEGGAPVDRLRRDNRWATVEAMRELRPESFADPPLERKIRMLTNIS